jgi:hypothetical protein
MSGPRPADDHTFVEPSWITALSEADAASRRLKQATTSMERLSRELAALKAWSDTTARLDLAHGLTDGPDGGPLNALVTLASAEEPEETTRQTARTLLDRITSALGLEPVGKRGEFLRLLRVELAEFEVRGPSSAPVEGHRELYCVVRSGWCLERMIVARPLLERVSSPKEPRAQGAPPGGGEPMSVLVEGP